MERVCLTRPITKSYFTKGRLTSGDIHQGLVESIAWGQPALVKLALKLGACCNISRYLCSSPLETALWGLVTAVNAGDPVNTISRYKRIIAILLEAGAHPWATDPRHPPAYGRTILHLAAATGSGSVCEALLGKGAGIDLGSRDADGFTPVAVAASLGNVRGLEAMLRDKPVWQARSPAPAAAVQIVDVNGRTPLHAVALCKSAVCANELAECVFVMLEAAGPVEAAQQLLQQRDKDGNTAGDLAAAAENKGVKFAIRIWQKFGMRIDRDASYWL